MTTSLLRLNSIGGVAWTATGRKRRWRTTSTKEDFVASFNRREVVVGTVATTAIAVVVVGMVTCHIYVASSCRVDKSMKCGTGVGGGPLLLLLLLFFVGAQNHTFDYKLKQTKRTTKKKRKTSSRHIHTSPQRSNQSKRVLRHVVGSHATTLHDQYASAVNTKLPRYQRHRWMETSTKSLEDHCCVVHNRTVTEWNLRNTKLW